MSAKDLTPEQLASARRQLLMDEFEYRQIQCDTMKQTLRHLTRIWGNTGTFSARRQLLMDEFSALHEHVVAILDDDTEKGKQRQAKQIQRVQLIKDRKAAEMSIWTDKLSPEAKQEFRLAQETPA